LPSWSFLRCIKFIYTNKENDPWANTISMGANQDCASLSYTGQCPVSRLKRPTNWPLSRKSSAPRLKFIGLSGVYQTVRWAHEQRSTSLTVDCHHSCAGEGNWCRQSGPTGQREKGREHARRETATGRWSPPVRKHGRARSCWAGLGRFGLDRFSLFPGNF
jgi:hypothetical protein